ncbi:MAG: Rne/Rng family ribonuclease [Aquificaceae bacterium]
MPKEVLCLSNEDYVFTFLVEDEKVFKIRVEKRGSSKIVDDLFVGKVKKVVKGMDGVFVDIGLDKEAYLPVKPTCRIGEEVKPPKVGESMVVQVVREPIGEKGAKLTNNIKLVGKYVVYLPTGTDIKYSLRLSKEDKERLKSIVSEMDPSGGLIFRTCSSYASKEDLLKDIESLRDLWQKVSKRSKAMRKPGLLLREYPCYIRAIRDYWYEIGKIVVDDPYVWSGIVSFLEEFEPSLVNKVVYTKDTAAYINKYRIHDLFRKMLSKYVWLRGGGYIVIDRTEAMTVIDVNSGEPCGESHEENAVNTNLEAAEEIAKQIILRDIGGIIVIDFIDMKKQENKDLVLKKFQETLGDELSCINIYGFTKLGLLEMARKKRAEGVLSVLTEDCSVCRGKGKIKSKELFKFELEKELKGWHTGVIGLHVRHDNLEMAKDLVDKLGLKHVNIVKDDNIGYNDYEVYHTA